MTKRTMYIVSGLLFILALILLIPGLTLGRYVTRVGFDITFSASSEERFYFMANADSSNPNMNFVGLGTINMPEDVNSTDISIVVQNFVGTRISNQDIEYKVELEENDKFSISPIERHGSLAKNVAATNTERFVLSKQSGADFSLVETVTLLVTSTSPLQRTLRVTLYIHKQEYTSYDLVYEVRLGDTTISSATASNEDELKILDDTFGSDRMLKVLNYSFYYDVNISSNYTAKIYVYRQDLDDSAFTDADWAKYEVKIEQNRGNDRDGQPVYYDLGTDVKYKFASEIVQVDLDNGPRDRLLEYVGVEKNANGNYKVVVKLVEKFTTTTDANGNVKKKPPVFNASYWLQTNNASGRGATADPSYIPENYETVVDNGSSGWGGTPANIKPETSSWNWGSYTNSSGKEMTEQADGTYSHVWIFQTNSGRGGYQLDSLELNGHALDIPFVPKIITYTDSYDLDATRDYIKTTILPDGTKATVEFLRTFSDGTQRVYRLTITNAVADITVSGGNLMMGQGAAEMVVYSLVGIDNNQVFINDDETPTQLSLVVTNSINIKKLKFKLKDFYHNPKIKITTTVGNEILSNPPITYEDGYYIADLTGHNMQSSPIALLWIEAEPMKFAFRYDKGDIREAQWSDGSDWDAHSYDDNNGEYYTIENLKVYFVSRLTPVDASGQQTFLFWYANSSEFHTYDLIEFQEFANLVGKPNEDGIYVIVFETIWNITN